MFPAHNLRYFIFLFIIGTIKDTTGLYNGDPCTFNDGTQGICKFLTDCTSAFEAIKKGILPTKLCGFEGTQSIVCCKDIEENPTPKPQTPPPTPKPTPKPTPTATKKPTKPPTVTSASSGERKPGVVSEERCKDYAQYVFERGEQPTLAGIPQFSNKSECVIDAVPQIVGGKEARTKEFPHMAHIGYETAGEVQWSCGGSLISENFVLTAAHCIKNAELGPAKLVRLGITNQTDTNHKQVIRVNEGIRHPDYQSKYHDIGLLRLETDADLNTFVRPACLYTLKEITFEKPIATGWGRIGYTEEGSLELLKVSLEFFTTAKCNKTYKRDIIAPDSSLQQGILENIMVCAGSTSEMKDTCQGDSGGPLQIVRKDTQEITCMYDIVGVTAFGKSCGLAKNVPGVYTRVSAYIKWIEDIVWPE